MLGPFFLAFQLMSSSVCSTPIWKWGPFWGLVSTPNQESIPRCLGQAKLPSQVYLRGQVVQMKNRHSES